MKKLTTIFGSVFFASIVLTSCGGGMEAEVEEVCNNVCESRSIMDKANEDPTNYDKLEKEAREIGKKNADLFCIGKKGRDHFKKRNYTIIEDHVEFWNELDFNHAVKFGNSIISHFLTGKVDEIRVVYNWFKNVGVQEISLEQLLPLSFSDEIKQYGNRIFEPSKKKIVQSLIPRHLNTQVWKYLLESYASEQAARMVAMENATENAGDMIKSLQLEFNKARQSAITTEMLEIVGGAEALVT